LRAKGTWRWRAFSRIEDRKFDVGRKSAIFHLTTVPRGDFNAQATKRTDFSAL